MNTNSATVSSAQRFLGLIPLDVNLELETKFNFKNKELEVLPAQIGTLLPAARKLDIGENPLTSVAELKGMKHLSQLLLAGCTRLQLTTLSCPNLVVLSIANCGLQSLEGLAVCKNTLKTLIANDNNIRLLSPEEFPGGANLPDPEKQQALKNYEVLVSLTQCQTIVISRNKQLCSLSPVASAAVGAEEEMETSERQSLGDQHPLSAFEKLSDLRKLSLSECGLHSLPQRWFLPYITELRLANNSLPSMQPEGVILRSIKILDVSNNKINDVSTLRRCKFVKQIAIKGNPLTAQHDGNGLYNLYRTVANLFEHLESVDGHPISDLLRSSKEEGSTAVKAPSAPLEEKDVVVDLPVVETVNQTSVVKRHRSLSDAPSTKAVVSGGDAISLLKKRKESSSW